LTRFPALRSTAAAAAFAATVLAAGPGWGAGLGLIRDAEIENTIRAYASPLFDAAGLDPDAVNVYLIQDKALNAFVAGGQNIFVTTGLLMRAENSLQVIGVIAHETGHIAGGHLARMADELRGASNQALIAQILGVLIAVGTGQGGAAVAVGAGGIHLAERTLLQYSRVQEQAADQAALQYLDRTRQSARGMAEFFDILGDQELLSAARQDPYVLTHPLTRDRAEFVRNHVAKSPNSGVAANPRFEEMFRRMRAKLVGFVEPVARTQQAYPDKDASLPARYARAIALYRAARLDAAVPLVDGLIAEEPKNPYFHELKGQMLFETGKVKEALAPYVESVRLAPNEPLLRTSLAHVQIELNDPALEHEALRNLMAALQKDTANPTAWRLAATAYGRNGDLGMSALSLAEFNLLTGKPVDARGQAIRAKRLLKEGSPGWLRAEDIERATDRARSR
jgi:predicted Zn-dependent protease